MKSMKLKFPIWLEVFLCGGLASSQLRKHIYQPDYTTHKHFHQLQLPEKCRDMTKSADFYLLTQIVNLHLKKCFVNMQWAQDGSTASVQFKEKNKAPEALLYM